VEVAAAAVAAEVVVEAVVEVEVPPCLRQPGVVQAGVETIGRCLATLDHV
jgi:hypothetical protein